MVSSNRVIRARLEVILAALAFGVSVPAGKLLLHGLSPLALSGGLYLVAGSFCAFLVAIRAGRRVSGGNRLAGRESLWLAAAIGFGGVLAPIALFSGLRLTSGFVAGLVLNFETVFTVGLAAACFGERVGKGGMGGILLVIAGAIVLSLATPSGSGPTRLVGPLLVLAACACWSIDNNLTQRVSLKDARQIVALKGLVGGGVTLLLAVLLGQIGMWSWSLVVGVGLVGIMAYGVSITLFIRGLRELGVIQTGALFALAPGFAALLSWLVLHEPLRPVGVLALLSMTSGAILLVTDLHEHSHTHEALDHAHAHTHDEHHQHQHTPEELAQSPHAHGHRHERVTHAHAHAHGAHHRHSH